MLMVCVKKMSVVGGTVSNITVGKSYNTSILLNPPNESDEIQESSRLMVWGDDVNSDYQYPKEAFVSIQEWREIQLGKLL
jgi:hypothetical protein